MGGKEEEGGTSILGCSRIHLFVVCRFEAGWVSCLSHRDRSGHFGATQRLFEPVGGCVAGTGQVEIITSQKS